MLMALCLTIVLLRDGHTSTQMPQPVQSSGATCRLYRSPSSGPPSLRAHGTALNVAGARFISSGENTAMRIAACGQSSTQIAHWVQTSASQIGISSAMLRFSHCVVPVGNVPSTGSARDRQQVAFAVEHHRRDALDEVRRGLRHHRPPRERRVGDAGHLDLRQRGERGVHGREVAREHGLAALAVGLADRVLDLRDGLVARQHARDREEARLRHGVDPAREAGFLGHGERVDHEEAQPALEDRRLRLARQLAPHLVGPVGAVQQEGRARARERQHVELLHELELVAGDEIGLPDQVRGLDRPRAEAQVRDGDRAGLLRVVDEVALRVQRRVLADDLDRVLGRADGAVRAEAVEHGARGALLLGVEGFVDRQREVGHVVDDADGEVALGRFLAQLVERGLGHRRREFLRRQAVAPADDARQRAWRRARLPRAR